MTESGIPTIVFVHSREGISLAATNSVNRLIAETAMAFVQIGMPVKIVAPDAVQLAGVEGIKAAAENDFTRRKRQLLNRFGMGEQPVSNFDKYGLQAALEPFLPQNCIVMAAKYSDAQLVKQINAEYRVIVWTHDYQTPAPFIEWLYGSDRPNAWVFPTKAIRQAYINHMQERGVWMPAVVVPNLMQYKVGDNISAGSHSAPVMLCLGGDNPKKGVHQIVAALKLLPDNNVIILNIAGCAKQQQQLLPNGVTVNYLPPLNREQVAEQIATADIGIVPSTWFENSPTAFLEMASGGLKMVASRVGGIPELADENTLLIDDHNDPNAWLPVLEHVQQNISDIRQQRHQRASGFVSNLPPSTFIISAWQRVFRMLG